MIAPAKLKSIASNLVISYTNSFVAFMVFLLLARLLGADDYAFVAIGIAVGGIIAPLFDMGSAKTFVRDAIRLKDEKELDKLVLSNISLRLSSSLIIICCLFVFCFLYADNITSYLAVTFLSLWSGLLGMYPTSWFDFKHRTSVQNLCVMIERVVLLVFIGGVSFIEIESLLIYVLAILMVCLRLSSITYQVKLWWKLYSQSEFHIRLKFATIDSKGVNILLTMALVSNALLTYGNQLVYGKFGDPVELSSYSLAFQFVSLIFLFQAQAIRVLNRDISEINKSKDQSAIIKNLIGHSVFLALVSAAMSILLLFVSDYIPIFIDDTRFNSISLYMPILSVWIVFVGMGQVVTQYLLEIKQEKFYLFNCIVAGVVAILLGIAYVPLNGAISVAYILTIVHISSISVNASRVLYVHHSRSKDSN